jgi:hypothetical protein
MPVLNISTARKWLGELLGRPGPISGRTWRALVDQGLPVGLIGQSPFVNTQAIELWLEERAGLPLASYPTPTPTPRNVAAPARRRGRPRKHVD